MVACQIQGTGAMFQITPGLAAQPLEGKRRFRLDLVMILPDPYFPAISCSSSSAASFTFIFS